MFRPAPTWISLADREVYRILQALHIQASLLEQFGDLDVSDSEIDFDVNDSEYLDDFCSSPPGMSNSSTLPLGVDMLDLLSPGPQHTSTYLDRRPSLMNSRDEPPANFTSENPVPARLRIGTAMQENGNDQQDAYYHHETEIPDSLTPLEEPPSATSVSTTAPSDSTLGVRRVTRSMARYQLV